MQSKKVVFRHSSLTEVPVEITKCQGYLEDDQWQPVDTTKDKIREELKASQKSKKPRTTT